MLAHVTAALACYPAPAVHPWIVTDIVLSAAPAGLAATPASPAWQVKLASDVLARLAGEYALDAQHRTKRKAYAGDLLKVGMCWGVLVMPVVPAFDLGIVFDDSTLYCLACLALWVSSGV
jgi:hypothetical protein